jgi:flagellin-like protein
MNSKNNKRGLSPIITTILLILLALVLAAIILLWARGFIQEKVSKFIPTSGEDRPIDEACEAVSLQIAITGNNELSIINKGDIPLYKLSIKIADSTSRTSTTQENSQVKGLSAGQSLVIQTDSSQPLLGNKVSVAPILLGKSDKQETKEYNCKNWVDVV